MAEKPFFAINPPLLTKKLIIYVIDSFLATFQTETPLCKKLTFMPIKPFY